eukprot:13515116-Alexandrium_andersonii.AAC.1
MGTRSLGKAGGGAVNVSNEPGGPHGILTARPNAEADRLIDGGRWGTRHADKVGSPETLPISRVVARLSIILGNI